MKRTLAALTLFFALAFAPLYAQSASRPVVLSWTPSTSSGVTGYAIYRCIVASGGTSCAPSTTGTPLATASGTTYTDTTTSTGSAYGYTIIAQAPACTSSTPLTTPCGNSAPVTVSYVPVPPQTSGASNVVVVVP